jgi:hypothetical protein
VERCEEEFQKVSKVIKMEFEQFEKNRIKEFKTIVTSYLEALAQHQEQVRCGLVGYIDSCSVSL